MERIQMVDLHNQYLSIKEEVDHAIASVLEETNFIKGPQVAEFEQLLSKYLDASDVISCANGTDALQLALMALDLPRGSEIIVPAFNYVSAAEVVLLLGMKPIFADADPDTYNLDVTKLPQLLSAKTRAIIPVHMFGQCCDMEPLLDFARENELFVIEDTAQAIGAEYTFSDGTVKKAGTMGDFGTFSFFPSKNLGCMGDGGAIVSKDKIRAEICRTTANHGQAKKFDFRKIGMNSRLDTIQAAVLTVKLKYLDSFNKKRVEAAKQYNSFLKNDSMIRIPEVAFYSTHVYHQYTLKIFEGRNKVREFLKEKGVPSVVYYPLPIHRQEAYKHFEKELPVSEKLPDQVISLPMHTELTEEQIAFISENLLVGLKE